MKGTTAIALRSPYHVILAADSRALYGANRSKSECKIFEVRNVYATVAGLAQYGSSYRAVDAIRDGFAQPGSFQAHIAATAYFLQRRVQMLFAGLRTNNPGAYQYLLRPGSSSDVVQLAVAQNVNGRPMLAIIELQQLRGRTALNVSTSICPGTCRPDNAMYYLGYWDRIEPYVANSGQPRSVGSAASLDRLIRMESAAHPREVGAPINVLEITSSGARWLQNGGNCSLPGVW
jgi:Proteasome subunit